MKPPASALRIVLASGNRHKLEEFRSMAAGLPLEILSPAAFGGMPPVVEDTGTFAGNAIKKASALRERLPPDVWALADDSGLCVDALGGAPGVESAYYAGADADPAANLSKLVEEMRDVPDGSRGAYFVCVLALAGPASVQRIFEGRCGGSLSRKPSGRGGFGYDPLFIPDGYDRSFAELGSAVKDRISHRAAAWKKLFDWVPAQE